MDPTPTEYRSFFNKNSKKETQQTKKISWK